MMTGGSGTDQFVFQEDFGQDEITDCDIASGTEVIDLSSVTAIADWADLKANHLTSDGLGQAVIFDGANTITLVGVLEADLAEDDVLF